MNGDGQNTGLDFVLPDTVPAPAAGTSSGGYSAAPIADLSYRNYDGPLLTRKARWWIVALNTLRLAKQKKGFWISAAISVLPYLIIVLQLYLQSRTQTPGGINPFENSSPGQRFASNFFQAYSFQGFFLFIIALMVGSGSIALDNRSNALLVYLSKPITKGDYLIGKWMGVFLALFAVSLVPSLILYVYCLLSYYGEGFLKNEPWLWLRIIGACAIPAAVHSSLILGFSAWSKTPRMAGAVYAGVFFIGQFIAATTWLIVTRGNMARGVLIQHLSIDGVIKGLGQNAFGVDLRMPTWNNAKQQMEALSIPPPSLQALLLLGGGLCLLGIVAARMRIRAVEVVKG
jgi:ABC-2 type transport system permease protein